MLRHSLSARSSAVVRQRFVFLCFSREDRGSVSVSSNRFEVCLAPTLLSTPASGSVRSVLTLIIVVQIAVMGMPILHSWKQFSITGAASLTSLISCSTHNYNPIAVHLPTSGANNDHVILSAFDLRLLSPNATQRQRRREHLADAKKLVWDLAVAGAGILNASTAFSVNGVVCRAGERRGDARFEGGGSSREGFHDGLWREGAVLQASVLQPRWPDRTDESLHYASFRFDSLHSLHSYDTDIRAVLISIQRNNKNP
ncbi:hypothetical protein M5K25_021513 [Dendrobium thyrsiflorum]|uniref:Uncharacterized protein n=1 Tax=Dendrobium thyrsiflorum TaxID=117978 RepID=A0ABD0UJI6_DENTH